MEKLQRLKSSLETMKTELAIKKSERTNLKEKLKENYDLDSVKQAIKRNKEIEKLLPKVRQKEEDLTEKIESKLDAYEEEQCLD